MATQSQQLQFAIRAVNEASAQLKDVQRDIGALEGTAEKSGGKLSGFAKGLGGVATVAGGIVAAGALAKVGGYLTSAVQGAIEDEAATKRLEQALRNLNGSFDQNLEKVNAAIDAGQKKAFTDDQVRDSFQTLAAATGDVDEALRRQQVAYDLSRGAGISLEQATRMVAKVNEESVDTFKRLGITIKDGATEAEALAAVQAKFAGQSDAYAASTAGQFEQAKIRMAEVKEQIGTALLPAVVAIATVFTEQVVPAIENFVTFVQEDVMPEVKKQFEKFQAYYESDIKPALDNIKTAIEAVVTFLKEHWGQIEPFVRPLFIAIQTAAEVALGAIKLAIDILGGDWEGAVNDMKEIWDSVVNGFDETFGAVKDQILVAVDLLKAGFEGIAGAIKGAFIAAVNEIIGLVNKAIEAYNKIPLAPNVPTIPTVGQPGNAHLNLPPGPVYGPATPVEGPPTPVLPGPQDFFSGGAGGGGGGTTVIVQGSVWSLDELAHELSRRGLVA